MPLTSLLLSQINTLVPLAPLWPTLVLTLIILVFAETIPKTIAAIYSEKFAFACCEIINTLRIIGSPLILSLNAFANFILTLCGINIKNRPIEQISKEELRSIMTEPSAAKLAKKHRTMLLGVLDLELATLKDIMIPRHQIRGICLTDPWGKTLKTIQSSHVSKILVYKNNIDHVTGVLSLRKATKLINTKLKSKEDKKNALHNIISKPYFVPEVTTLHNQLIAFQRTGHDLAIVVDEYGDIQGIVTLRDILEEIVGELDQQAPIESRTIVKQEDDSYTVQGYISVRELNRLLQIELPLQHAKTLSGLITHYLDDLPKPKTSVMVNNYPIEIITVKGKAVKKAKIHPKLKIKNN